MQYTLSEQTAEGLQRLLGEAPSVGIASQGDNYFNSHLSFVKITGSLSSGRYPCVASQIQNNGTWVDFTGTQYVYPNGATLTSGTRYFAMQIGDDTSGNPQWVCTGGGGGGSVSVSCDGDGHLVVVTS